MTDSKPGQGGGQAGENRETLYSRAQLHGVAYGVFSASRIDARARFRYRSLLDQKAPLESNSQTVLEPPPAIESSGAREMPVCPISPVFEPIPDQRPPQPPAAAPASSAHPAAQPSGPSGEDLSPLPQWLQPASHEPGQGSSGGGASAGGETLQRAKERVASRWFALKGLFARSATAAESLSEQGRERPVPVIAIFSFAGGVGKTSLIANLGRALASHGERVLLAETTPFGLLPFYFGARDLKTGVVRTFAPPGNCIDAPVHVVTLDAEEAGEEGAIQDRLVEALRRDGLRSQRILVDVQTGSAAVVRRLFPLMPAFLAPLLPEMNSVMSVRAMENLFSGAQGATGENIKPMYLLNQFDASLPLHVDVREILQEQLGNRLLPFVLRRSPAVSEALAEGMTVVDYAPHSIAAEDYLRLADWCRSVAAAGANSSGMRWSER